MKTLHRTLLTVLLATTACDRDAAKDEPQKNAPAVAQASAAPAAAKPTAPAAAKVAEPTPPPAPAQPEPLALDNERVIAIAAAARELQDAPEKIEEVLERHGLDRPTFEASVNEIAKDAWKSDLYIAALSRPAQN